MTEEELKLVFTVSFFDDVLKVFCEFKYLRWNQFKFWID
jgi:hypothetical protein